MKVAATCAHCTAEFQIERGALNRAMRNSAPVYCGRECSGLGRRKWKSPEQKKAEKAAYDVKCRRKNRELLKRKKAAYHQRTYDPEKAAIERKKRMPRHIEYCRRPEYRTWKREYDRQHRAKKFYGEFWECHLLAMDIRAHCLTVQSDYEMRREKRTLNKTQQRKRDYERVIGKLPEIGPLGNLERCQGGQDGTGAC
ncbi:MAG: hypothetical protein JJ902_03860 [Roseibium sp.]|nr:hypothetical protein [Roseibium sp.]